MARILALGLVLSLTAAELDLKMAADWLENYGYFSSGSTVSENDITKSILLLFAPLV